MSVLREINPLGMRGAITAQQAFALAEKELKKHGAATFRFTFISAGEYIDHRGEFFNVT